MPSLIETIRIEMSKEYNVNIAKKIIEIIESEEFDDETVWDDVKEDDESSLKDRMSLKEFNSLKRICNNYYNPKPKPKPKPGGGKTKMPKLVRDYDKWNEKKKKTRQIYLKQCPLLIKADQDETLMNTATLGRDNKMPLISYFVDTFNRYRINQFTNNGKVIDTNKFTDSLPFYKKLQKSEQKGTKVHSILETYQARFAPKLTLSPQQHLKFDKEKVEDILRYIYGVSQMIDGIIKNNNVHDSEDDIIPFQFDLVLLPFGGHDKINNDDGWEAVDVSDEELTSDSDEEPEEEYGDNSSKKNDKIGKIEPRLKKYNIKHVKFQIEQKQLNSNASAVIKRKFNEKFKEIRKGRNGRYVMIVDRRDETQANKNNKTSDDKIYIYSPKCEDNNNDEKKDKDKDDEKKDGHEYYHKIHKKYVEESLVYKTTKCLIPGLNEHLIDPHLGCKDPNLITLSFHILSSDVIKCYLYLNGGGTRFEATDLINILPKHFKKQPPAHSKLLDNDQLEVEFPLKLKDPKFQEWYKATTQKKADINHGRY